MLHAYPAFRKLIAPLSEEFSRMAPAVAAGAVFSIGKPSGFESDFTMMGGTAAISTALATRFVP